jgi:CRP-like cAMP-binding protein
MLESQDLLSFASVWPPLNTPQPLEALPPRRKVVQEGRRCDQLFIVDTGWLVAFRQLPDGGRQIFNFWLPGEVCGVELIACPTAPYCVATMTECRLWRMSRETIARRDFDLSDALTALACRNSLILRERIVGLGRRSAHVRVVHLLLELTYRRRWVCGFDEPLPLTQLEVADSTGLTETYVNRIFKRLRNRDQLAVSREGLRLLDPSTLMREVQFNPAYLGKASTPAQTVAAA